MSKKQALILFFFFDLFALCVFWIGYDEIKQVFAGVAHSVDVIKFSNRVGVPFIMIALPVVHVLGLYDYFRPGSLAKKTALINRLVIIIGIVLFAIVIYISTHVKTYVEQADYLYCRGASSASALFKTLVYTKDSEVCDRLTEDKRRRMNLPPR